MLHSLLADHAERLLVWALGGATVKAARLAKMIPVIVLHCLKGHHEDPVEEEPPKPRKPRKSTFQQLPRYPSDSISSEGAVAIALEVVI